MNIINFFIKQLEIDLSLSCKKNTEICQYLKIIQYFSGNFLNTPRTHAYIDLTSDYTIKYKFEMHIGLVFVFKDQLWRKNRFTVLLFHLIKNIA